MRIASRSLAVSLVAGLMAVAGCRRSNEKAADSLNGSAVVGAAKDSAPGGMAAMPGMAGAASGKGMMDSMETHMRTMTTASTGQLKTLLPMHRQMVANMISQMNQEMRTMNMPATPAWTATMDSVRQDLIHQPDMSAGDLAASLPSHHARITRLLGMHRDMMAKMKS